LANCAALHAKLQPSPNWYIHGFTFEAAVMNAITTKTFRSGNSEAVRLPKDMGFGAGTEVEIVRKGNEIIIRPRQQSLAWLGEQLRTLPPPEFALERDAVEPPMRDWDR
jgi:antitoxin VapB